MKTITITISEELDAAAAAEAKRRGMSKSGLIRHGLRLLLPEDAAADGGDLWIALAGFASEQVTAEPGEIDDVVYGS